MTLKPHQTKDWYIAQRRVRQWLAFHKIKAYSAAYQDHFDLQTESGQKLEIKLSSYAKSINGWRFNIHRHGVLNEAGVDCYILRFEPGQASDVLGTSAFHLVIPAPIGVHTLLISVRALMCGEWAKYFNNVMPLALRESALSGHKDGNK